MANARVQQVITIDTAAGGGVAMPAGWSIGSIVVTNPEVAAGVFTLQLDGTTILDLVVPIAAGAGLATDQPVVIPIPGGLEGSGNLVASVLGTNMIARIYLTRTQHA